MQRYVGPCLTLSTKQCVIVIEQIADTRQLARRYFLDEMWYSALVAGKIYAIMLRGLYFKFGDVKQVC